MLRDGKFIKEEAPKIGSAYVTKKQRELDDDEQAWQHVFLSGFNKGVNYTRWGIAHLVLGLFALYALSVILTGVIRGWRVLCNF